MPEPPLGSFRTGGGVDSRTVGYPKLPLGSFGVGGIGAGLWNWVRFVTEGSRAGPPPGRGARAGIAWSIDGDSRAAGRTGVGSARKAIRPEGLLTPSLHREPG